MENKQRSCDHQYTDSGSKGPDFNYCPWCGQRLTQPTESQDDCIKGGCND